MSDQAKCHMVGLNILGRDIMSAERKGQMLNDAEPLYACWGPGGARSLDDQPDQGQFSRPKPEQGV